MKQVLGTDELAAVAILQGLEQNAACQPGLTHSSRTNKNDVLGFGYELTLGKGANLLAADAGLAWEGKGFQRPSPGHVGPAEPPLQGGFLARVPLGSHHTHAKPE